MSNILTLTGAPKTLVQTRPAGRLGSRTEPCAVLNVSHMQDTQLRLVSELIASTFSSLLLSLPHDQAEESIQNAVDIGIARAMRDK